MAPRRRRRARISSIAIGDHRDDDDRHEDHLDVAPDEGDLTEEEAEYGDAAAPEDAADDVVFVGESPHDLPDAECEDETRPDPVSAAILTATLEAARFAAARMAAARTRWVPAQTRAMRFACSIVSGSSRIVSA
ncbi:hypothetical protein [Micromonospora carbonacea]|uniref:hypothetical protein n=1 Tax=Micromonospora carbonacea TaxID=47853 RepID=UPI003720127B